MSVPLRFICFNLILFDIFATLMISIVDPPSVLTGVELFPGIIRAHIRRFPPPHPKDTASGSVSHTEPGPESLFSMTPSSPIRGVEDLEKSNLSKSKGHFPAHAARATNITGVALTLESFIRVASSAYNLFPSLSGLPSSVSRHMTGLFDGDLVFVWFSCRSA